MFGDNKTIKILFFGDLVGRPGRFALRDYLSKNVTNDKQFIIANVENASHGFGLTEKNYNEKDILGFSNIRTILFSKVFWRN